MSGYLGESYDYWKSIRQPEEMGMSPGFSLSALATNVDGLMSYVEVLISGTGPASSTGKPLGNKFFVETTGKCSETTLEKWKKEREEDEAWETAYKEVDYKVGAKKITEDEAVKLKNALNEDKAKRDAGRDKEKKKVNRFMYVNNIPDGSVPFLADAADGRGFQSLRGLIPGALGNLAALNPVQLFNGFTAGTYPDCAEITLETINNENVSRNETRHVALIDIVQLNPCSLKGRVNPATGKRCKLPESFNAMGNGKDTTPTLEKENPTIIYEVGTLAGSSGVAYQTTHRSPLSYNMEKSTGKSELSYDLFHRKGKTSGVIMNAREVMAQHDANASSFYDKPIAASSESDPSSSSGVIDVETEKEGKSVYTELVDKLSSLFDQTNNERRGEDLSTLKGDTVLQVYYYSITAILLYLFYRILYKKRR
jgi:hypothetical protein